MTIGDRPIGPGRPVFVIAEIGVNHDGSVDRALELVAHAKAGGADAVKVQVFRADTLVHRSAELAEYQKSRVAAADPAAMLRQYELDDDALRTVAAATADAGLATIATPFSPSDVPRAAAVAAAIKIASPDLINRLLLTRAVETGLPLLVSSGAATADEIQSVVAWLTKCWHGRSAREDTGGTPVPPNGVALLHCVSHYPVADVDAQLAWIDELAQHGLPVGYSDHAADPAAGALAVACGACLIEKHLTYDTAAAGPDHAASLDPTGFAEYVRRIRQAERMLGTRGRRVLACETDVRRVSRQSLVAARDVAAGATIVAADLTTQRPGTGLSAERYEQALGRRATRPIRRGEMLTPADVGLDA